MIVIARFDRELPRPWHGSVEAVWSGAALAWPADLGGQDPLTLLAPGRGLVGDGIEIPWNAPPTPGSVVLVGQRTLRVGDRTFRLAGPGVDLTLDDEHERDCGALRRHLALLDIPAPAVPEAAGRLRPVAKWLFGAECSREPDAAVEGLVGLGPGLTPTGDDVLVGALAAANWLAGATTGDRLLDLGSAIRERARNSTTMVSRAMLRNAARGCFPEPLVLLVRTLGDPSATDGRVRAAAAWLEAVGEHSGRDMLAGLAITFSAAREGGN